MLRDRAKEYYLDKSYNCAEAILLAANDEYGLGLSGDAVKLVGGFGGGMGCGKACGALCGGISAIGQACIEKQAHESPRARELSATYFRYFVDSLGTDQCEELMKVYKKEDVRCLETVLLAADELEKVFAAIPVE